MQPESWVEPTLLDRTALTLLFAVFVKLTVVLAVGVAVTLLARVVLLSHGAVASLKLEVALLVQNVFTLLLADVTWFVVQLVVDVAVLLLTCAVLLDPLQSKLCY